MAKEIHKRISVWLNQQGIENNLKSVRTAINKTANELAKLPIGTEEWYRKSEKLKKLKDIQLELRKETKLTAEAIKEHNEKLNDTVVAAGAISAVYATASSAIRRFISATQEYVDAYASLDDAMTSVSKYTGLTREEVKQLNEEFQKMDTRTPTEKLNALAADAGRLGITSKEAIKDFVEAADIINVALGEDLGEDAVKEIGKLAEMFGTTETMGLRGAMLATGSAINTLAQSSSASERYLMDFTSRLAGAANQAKISQADILGFASVLDQNKQQVEMSATAMQKLLMNMFTAPEKYARLAGVSVKEFSDALKNDANEALLSFLDTLNKKGGLSELAPIFKELGLDGARASGVISVLAGKIDDVREAQLLANTAFADGNSVINEAAAVNGNAAAQLEKAKKAVEDAKAALGEELIPVITKLTKMSASGITVISEAVKFMKQHKVLIAALAAAYSSLTAAHLADVAAKKLSSKWTKIMSAGEAAGTTITSLFALAKAKLAKNTLAAANAQKALKVAFAATPWGAIITAVTTLATAFVFMRNKTDEATETSEKFNKEVAKEQVEAERLFEKLKKAEKGTTEYQEALDALKEKYPEIIQKHLDEEGALRDVEQAYKDVITQIQAKVAAQVKEEELTEATEKGIKKQVKALRGFTEAQKATIRQMAEQGKGVEQISSTLGLSYYFTDIQGRQVKDDRYQALKDYVTAYENMKKDLVAIDKKYDPYLQQSSTSSINRNGGGGDGVGGGSGNDPDKKLQTRIDNFEKKLQEFRNRQQRETMDGWEKTKQTVIDSYQSMIDEASALYGEGSQKVKDLMTERDQAIAAAGQKYLEKYGKTLEDFSQKFQTWQKEVAPESNNEMVDAVLGTRQKWIQRTNEAANQMQELLDIRKLFVADNIDTTAIDELINKLGDSMNGFADLEAQDIQKTLEKYQKDIDTFITNEQKDVTNATLSETERQKQAIREKYELEIQLIEKLKAARKAQNGENADVSDLEAQIEKLKKLLDQQLSNVDAQASKSASKTIWQQLAEFDWSKMSDNWQQGLNLMSQGLQEFANVAFDIYGSIAQIQNNLMEAELQKAQETYDAKSAALKRQLDQGVISQKAYDAKMQKLNEEKEKKERKLKHEQFAREKTANIIQGVVNAALAITNIWSQWAGQPIVAAILTAISAATTAAQIAAIASQPNPYAKGGYIRGRQYAVMGEQGDEWVASNKLLRDREASAVIAALDDYQRGNRLALQGITFAAPDTKTLSQAISQDRRTFATSNQTTNNYYQNSENSELLKEIRQMNEYLRDPKNRRAYISREIQIEFDEQEKEIRELARL